jgi:hypothetical protein
MIKGNFRINLEKAKEIHRNHIRLARKPLLEKLDAEYMKALEKGDTARMNEVAQEKQVLRDLTQCDEICNCTCCEDLKNHWPECLCDCPNPYDEYSSCRHYGDRGPEFDEVSGEEHCEETNTGIAST